MTKCLFKHSAVCWSNCGNKNDKSVWVEQTIYSTKNDV